MARPNFHQLWDTARVVIGDSHYPEFSASTYYVEYWWQKYILRVRNLTSTENIIDKTIERLYNT